MGLDFCIRWAYKTLKGVVVLRVARQDRLDLEDKKVVYLEFVAAFAILSIVALVLYMVFSYRPA